MPPLLRCRHHCLLFLSLPSSNPISIPTLLFSSTPKSHATSSSTRVSLYLRRAHLIDTIRQQLHSHHPSSSPFPLPSNIDPFVAAHSLRSAPSPDSALALFRSLQSHSSFSHSHHTIHALARILSLSNHRVAIHSLLDSIDAGSFPNTLPPSPTDRLRWHAASGDLHSALQAWAAIRSAAPGPGRRQPCTEPYNLIMGLYVTHRMDSDAVGILWRMVEDGVSLNSRTYTVIIEHLVKVGRLDVALEVFDRLPLMRVRRTSKQYNVLADGLSSVGRFVELKNLIMEMRSDGILPGRAVRAAMIMMREVGHVEGTEEFAEELSPDNKIRFVGGSGGESGSEEDEDEEGVDNGGATRLKPWLDPDALASALGDWDKREVEALEEAKFVWTARLVCKLLRGFNKAETAWKFFCWVTFQPGGFKHNRYTISRMIAILARNGHDGLVDRLIGTAKSDGILLPFSTVRVVVDFYGSSKKAEATLRVLRDVTSICGPVSDSNWRLLCSSLLQTLAKCRRGNMVLEVLEEIIREGVVPDIQTFSGLMQFFATEGDLRNVHKVLGIARQCGLQPDAYMYQVLIKGYIRHKRSDLVVRVFDDMMRLNLVPDAATKSLLVKSLWDEGKRHEAAYVEERSEEGREGLPVGLGGQAWCVSSADLVWVYNIYRDSILKARVSIDS